MLTIYTAIHRDVELCEEDNGFVRACRLALSTDRAFGKETAEQSPLRAPQLLTAPFLRKPFHSVHAQSLAQRLFSLECLGAVVEEMSNHNNGTIINHLINWVPPSSVEHSSFPCINSKAVKKPLVSIRDDSRSSPCCQSKLANIDLCWKTLLIGHLVLPISSASFRFSLCFLPRKTKKIPGQILSSAASAYLPYGHCLPFHCHCTVVRKTDKKDCMMIDDMHEWHLLLYNCSQSSNIRTVICLQIQTVNCRISH